MDFAKLLGEGLEVSENVAKALEVSGRVLTKLGAAAKDQRITLVEVLEIAGGELGGK